MDDKFSFNDELGTTGNDNEIKQEKYGSYQNVQNFVYIKIE